MKYNKENLLVISSFAKDKITYRKSGETLEKIGGPAFWISRTLKDIGMKFDIITGKRDAEIEITVNKNGESGIIRSVSEIIPEAEINADFIIISTIADEFKLETISNNFKGEIALDLQGYIRASKLNNKEFILPKNIGKKIKIIKLTEEELDFLKSKFIDSYPDIIFIITKGKFGADIIKNGSSFHYCAPKIKFIDTLGAGDVFLAAFTAQIIKCNDIPKSGNYANNYVSQFLKKNKSIEEHEQYNQ